MLCIMNFNNLIFSRVHSTGGLPIGAQSEEEFF